MSVVVGVTTYGPDAAALAALAPAERARADRYTLPTDYVAAIRRAGGLPLLVPPGERDVAALVDVIDALVLPGGGDVDPARYGGSAHATIYAVDPARDEMELALARLAVERGLPLLAICRGVQVLDVVLGGTLIEHLPDVVGTHVAHRGDGPGTRAFHAVEIAPGSRLAAIVGATHASPSSSHHQAIRTLGRGLRVVARAPDETIEAVEHDAHPFLVGVQWHPEHTAASDPAQQRLFDALVGAARSR